MYYLIEISSEGSMHKILIIAATCLSLAACTTTQQGAAVGAVGGGIVGAAAGGTNQCIYERRDGTRYYDVCPKG